MSAQRVRDEAVEVLRFLSRPPAPEGATDYQLNRHIMGNHGPEAVTELRRELTELGLIEATTDAQGWQRSPRETGSHGRRAPSSSGTSYL